MIEINEKAIDAEKVFYLDQDTLERIRNFVWNTAGSIISDSTDATFYDSSSVLFKTGLLIQAVFKEFKLEPQLYYAMLEVGYFFGYNNATNGKNWNPKN